MPRPTEKVNVLKWFKINKQLFLLKLMAFVWYAGYISVLPYLAIHLKQKGLSIIQVSLIFSLLTISQITLAPFVISFADKLGRYKTVLMTLFLITVIFSTSILFIPEISISDCTSTKATLKCRSLVGLQLNLLSHNCSGNSTKNLNLEINKCISDCHDYNISQKENQICFEERCLQIPFHENDKLTVNLELYEYENDCNYRVKLLDNHHLTNVSNTHCFPSGLENCNYTCNVKFSEGCMNKSKGNTLTFALSFVFVTFFLTFMPSIFRLIDVVMLVTIKKYNAEFGQQRIWYNIAAVIFSPLSGYVIDIINENKEKVEYYSAFCIFNGLTLICMVCLFYLKIDNVPPTKNLSLKTFQLLTHAEISFLFFAVLCAGILWGCHEIFIGWFLVELKSPKVVIGLTNAVSGLAAIPLLIVANKFGNKIGRANALLLGFFLYFVRYTGMSYIYDPWLVLLFEIMKSYCYHLFWVIVVLYSSSLTPTGVQATVQGIAGSIHFGLGRGLGSIIGGSLIDTYGIRVAFRALGIAAIVLGCMYAFMYHILLPRCPTRSPVQKDEKDKHQEIDKEDLPELKLLTTDVAS